jgi:hypothetical protein
MKTKIINWLIKVLSVDTNKISDGYHTFESLYEHRIELWIALCRQRREWAWKSKVHSDGTVWEGWFILGMGITKGEQMTYHLPMKYWKQIPDIETVKKAYEWDKHTEEDVLERLKGLI